MRADAKDAGHLWDMLESARETRQLLHGYTLGKLLADARTRRALERTLEVLGEAANRVSVPMREAQPRIPWAKIIGQRNVIAHGYAVIDHSRLYRTVTEDVPGLIAELEQIVKALETDPE
ncbi:MAG: hypothetical protein A3I00_08905 [Betaproteobacteria bacterium RIFCSPLOWO2_02_FULL_64_12]|nr:MAG: hypothetical protein A3I00_08905 [Betaproteobacteria bacterium RIFCSPLOWO2_02_FULL_64_12]